MDRITQSLVTEFVNDYDLQSCPPNEQFEHFANYSVVSSEYHESFDPEDVHVGKDANPGIDGLAIIVNGSLVTDEAEVNDLVVANKYLEATFIFCQAKTSPRFEGGDIGSFIEAVRDFFRPEPLLVRGADLQAMAKVADRIFSYTSRMRGNPACLLYFVTTGTWNNDQNLEARLSQGRNDLDITALFSDVKVTPCGAREIQQLYRASNDTLAVEIDFPNKVPLPEISGVGQAFVGVLPVSTLFQLFLDESGNIRRSVFEDNVRDYQGDTSVNLAIATTLSSIKAPTFVILNNGVTVVCRELQQTGTRCTLRGYQIVNGCQTSHVLYSSKAHFDPEKVFVSVKLIGAENEELVNSIIRATNSQNAVKPEELEAMTEFQRLLESYYQTFSAAQALYYERRSKQWAAAEVEKTRIVTIPSQIKSFASMFLDVPHRVAGYYGTVRGRLGDAIFKTDHRPIPYFTSSFCLYRLDSLFRSKVLDAKYKPLRWYLLLLFRNAVAGPIPPLNSAKIDSYCDNLLHKLRDNDRSAAIFEDIAKRIDGAVPQANSDNLKTQSLRDLLLGLVPAGCLADA